MVSRNYLSLCGPTFWLVQSMVEVPCVTPCGLLYSEEMNAPRLCINFIVLLWLKVLARHAPQRFLSHLVRLQHTTPVNFEATLAQP